MKWMGLVVFQKTLFTKVAGKVGHSFLTIAQAPEVICALELEDLGLKP